MALGVFLISVGLSAGAAPQICVSPTGSDAGDGSAAKPFRTLTRARDAVRELKARGGLAEGLSVVLAPGVYPVSETLFLGAADSGSDGAPIVWCCEKPGAAVLDGGFRVSGWRALSAAEDEAALQQLDSSVRAEVRVAEVARAGYPIPESQVSYGGAIGDGKRPRLVTDLYRNGEPLTLAREPDAGFAHVTASTNRTILSGALLSPDRLRRERELMASGYWFYGWWDETARVISVGADGSLALDPTLHEVIKVGQPYYLLNALCALNRPNEWYLDRAAGRLYAVAPSAKSDYVLSSFARPFVSLTNAQHLVFRNLAFRYGRGDAVVAGSCEDLRFERCSVTRFGGCGLVLNPVRKCRVSHCRLDCLGHGGVRLVSGDRRTLDAGESEVSDCEISRPDRHRRTYSPCVHVDGVGVKVEHNHFHDANSSAIALNGNDHFVGYNLVERVVQESDDQGGLDTCAYPSYLGNRIVANIWRDIGRQVLGTEPVGQAGVRLDDQISSFYIASNRFIRCATGNFGGVQMNSGIQNRIENNLFIGCATTLRKAAISEGNCTSWYWDWRLKKKGYISSKKWKEDVFSAAYRARYPQVETIYSWPMTNYLARNIAVGAACVREQKVWVRPKPPHYDYLRYDDAGNVCVETEAEIESAAKAIGFAALPPESEIGPR